ncbi:hypothetical protein T484DRAFT_1914367 [Baffinella frigidus]|nr:hypothetical protein T484DRAFT_1914367 [Cryptophyta sp. CCMP2293]
MTGLRRTVAATPPPTATTATHSHGAGRKRPRNSDEAGSREIPTEGCTAGDQDATTERLQLDLDAFLNKEVGMSVSLDLLVNVLRDLSGSFRDNLRAATSARNDKDEDSDPDEGEDKSQRKGKPKDGKDAAAPQRGGAAGGKASAAPKDRKREDPPRKERGEADAGSKRSDETRRGITRKDVYQRYEIKPPGGYGASWTRPAGWSGKVHLLASEAADYIDNNRAGKFDLGHEDKMQAKIKLHALLLLPLLPPSSLATMAQVDLGVAERMGPEEAVGHVISSMGEDKNNSRQLENARTTLLKLLYFLEQRKRDALKAGHVRDVPWDNGAFDGGDVAAYLKLVRKQAAVKVGSTSGSGQQLKPNTRTGRTAFENRLTAIRWLSTHMGVVLGLDTPALADLKLPGRKDARPYYPLPLRSLCAMEDAALHHKSKIVRGVSAGFCALTHACVRLTQGSLVWYVSKLKKLGVAKCIARRPKHPRGTPGAQEAFYIPRRGVLGTSVFKALKQALIKTSGGYLVRDFIGPSILTATKWRDQPLTGRRASAQLRILMRHLGGVPEERLVFYGMASLRHVLPEAYVDQSQSLKGVTEIGRWSKSAVARVGLSSGERAFLTAHLSELEVPRMYAPLAAEELHAKLLCTTIANLRVQVRAAPGGDWRALAAERAYVVVGRDDDSGTSTSDSDSDSD